MMWRCPAIEKGVVIYDNGVIRPCCVIDWSYQKPIEFINDKNRFLDLYNLDQPPAECSKCHEQEKNNLASCRENYLKLETCTSNSDNLQFLDIRNSNFCNAKCRFCGPHHSHLWELENTGTNQIRHLNIENYFDILLNEDLVEIYFAGGEPLISPDHYLILKNLIDKKFSKNINLRYSSNLSTLKYKDINLFDLWKEFKSVTVMASADGIGEVYENIRSGLSWNTFEKNIKTLITNNINFNILFILNNLNIWFLKESLSYYKQQGWEYSVDLIRGPSDYTLGEIPNNLKEIALNQIDLCYDLLSEELYEYIKQEIKLNPTGGFNLNINDQRSYDKIRKESMIKLLTDAKILNE